MKFSDLQFKPHPNYPDTGVQATHFFENGYGVSVVQFTTPYGPGSYGYEQCSYGYEQGLYEVAILQGVAENWKICYDTVLTDDVLGYQSEEEVEILLYEVENL